MFLDIISSNTNEIFQFKTMEIIRQSFLYENDVDILKKVFKSFYLDKKAISREQFESFIKNIPILFNIFKRNLSLDEFRIKIKYLQKKVT